MGVHIRVDDGKGGKTFLPCPICESPMDLDVESSTIACSDMECPGYFMQVDVDPKWAGTEPPYFDMEAALMCCAHIREDPGGYTEEERVALERVAASAIDRLIGPIGEKGGAVCFECGGPTSICYWIDRPAVGKTTVEVKCSRCGVLYKSTGIYGKKGPGAYLFPKALDIIQHQCDPNPE